MLCKKFILAWVSAIMVIVVLICYIAFKPKSITTDSVDMAPQNTTVGSELTDKERYMLKQYAKDMHNDYHINVQSYTKIQEANGSVSIKVNFDDTTYTGEVFYDAEQDKWIARLSDI